eukprot:jgi/Mesvir1/7144/Mv02504-RA.1
MEVVNREESARLLFSSRNYVEAAEEYAQLAQEQPNCAKWLTNRAKCFFNLGRHAVGLIVSRKAILVDRSWSRGYEIAGECLLILHRYEEAEELLVEGTQAAPGASIEKLLRDAGTAIDKQREDAQYNLMPSAYPSKGSSGETGRKSARLAMRTPIEAARRERKQWVQSLARTEQLSLLDAEECAILKLEQRQASLCWAANLWSSGHVQEAINICEQDAEDHQSTAALSCLACIYMNGHGVAPDPAKGLAYANQCLRYAPAAEYRALGTPDPSAPVAHELLGVAYQQGVGGHERDLQQAEKWLRRAADQGNVSAVVRLASVLKEPGCRAEDVQEAVGMYRRAVDISGQLSCGHFSCGHPLCVAPDWGLHLRMGKGAGGLSGVAQQASLEWGSLASSGACGGRELVQASAWGEAMRGLLAHAREQPAGRAAAMLLEELRQHVHYCRLAREQRAARDAAASKGAARKGSAACRDAAAVVNASAAMPKDSAACKADRAAAGMDRSTGKDRAAGKEGGAGKDTVAVIEDGGDVKGGVQGPTSAQDKMERRPNVPAGCARALPMVALMAAVEAMLRLEIQQVLDADLSQDELLGVLEAEGDVPPSFAEFCGPREPGIALAAKYRDFLMDRLRGCGPLTESEVEAATLAERAGVLAASSAPSSSLSSLLSLSLLSSSSSSPSAAAASTPAKAKVKALATAKAKAVDTRGLNRDMVAHALLTLGKLFLAKGMVADAHARFLLPAAKVGNADACHLAGRYLAKRGASGKDLRMAQRFLSQAAARDVPGAHDELDELTRRLARGEVGVGNNDSDGERGSGDDDDDDDDDDDGYENAAAGASDRAARGKAATASKPAAAGRSAGGDARRAGPGEPRRDGNQARDDSSGKGITATAKGGDAGAVETDPFKPGAGPVGGGGSRGEAKGVPGGGSIHDLKDNAPNARKGGVRDKGAFDPQERAVDPHSDPRVIERELAKGGIPLDEELRERFSQFHAVQPRERVDTMLIPGGLAVHLPMLEAYVSGHRVSYTGWSLLYSLRHYEKAMAALNVREDYAAAVTELYHASMFHGLCVDVPHLLDRQTGEATPVPAFQKLFAYCEGELAKGPPAGTTSPVPSDAASNRSRAGGQDSSSPSSLLSLASPSRSCSSPLSSSSSASPYFQAAIVKLLAGGTPPTLSGQKQVRDADTVAETRHLTELALPAAPRRLVPALLRKRAQRSLARGDFPCTLADLDAAAKLLRDDASTSLWPYDPPEFAQSPDEMAKFREVMGLTMEYGIGLCEFKLGCPAAAATRFKRFLQGAPEDTEDMAESVSHLCEALVAQGPNEVGREAEPDRLEELLGRAERLVRRRVPVLRPMGVKDLPHWQQMKAIVAMLAHVRRQDPRVMAQIVAANRAKMATKGAGSKGGTAGAGSGMAGAAAGPPASREEVAGVAVKTCWGCSGKAASLQRCGGCRLAGYCSRECQKKHWKEGHREACAKLAS